MNALDKEEFRIKLEEINKLIEKKDYESAMDIVDSIDWHKVKNIRTLCVVGEIYAANKRYEESKEIFLLAYHRAPIGKTILYRLIEVSLRMGDVKEAEEFYEEYKNIAPKDTSCYVLQYKILRVKKAPIEKQIEILEEYKEKEFTEKWSFELAKLYYKIGEREKSLEVCDDLILWFSEGKYVTKALDLKLRMGAISQSEREKYEKQFIPKLITPEEAAVVKEEVQDAQSENSEEELSVKAGEIEKIKIKQEAANAGVGGIVETTGVLQEKIAKGIKDIFSGIHKERKEEELFDQRLEEDSQVSDETSELEQEMKPQEVVDDIEKSVDVEEAPPLESEKLLEEQQKEEENFIEKTEDSEEKPDIWNEPLKMPELKIPDRIKLSNQIEAPKAKVIPEFVLPTDEELAKQQEEQKEEESKDLNLEDMILAAASEQGIEVPEDYEDAVKKETVDEEELSEFSDMDSSEEETVEETVEADVEPEQEVFAGREKESYADKPESEDYEESDLEDDGLELEQFNLDEELSREREEFVASLEVDDSEEETEKEDSLVVEASNQDLKREPQDWDNENNREEDIEVLDDILVDTDTEIVPRKMAFDDEEEKLFTYFVKIPGMKEQILDALLDVQLSAADKTSKSGNVIVMGNRGCGKTRLIQGFVPAACRELNLKAVKVAYVFGDELNGQDIAKVVDKLSGGFLVIEQANQLSADTVEQLNKAMEFRTDGLTVIIEDEKIGMRKLIAKYPKFAAKFTSMVNIPVFTNDELVAFAKIYTKENGYVIDQMGILALYNLIGDNQKEDEPMTIQAVKKMVDAAIEKAESGARKLTRNLSKKRTDVEGMIVLYEKDFS